MAFGTGTHETTRLCLRLLEDAVRPVCTVLDVGTGSGILAIAARLLGAGTVTGVDIDPVAVRAASENAARNNMEAIRLICGDLTGMLLGPFDVITANLTADILMRLAPGLPGLLKQDGFFICSGIIATRALEVRAALDGVGFEPTLALEENGWVAFSCRERS
jgi:ribosomal protein L11 methyltransferase